MKSYFRSISILHLIVAWYTFLIAPIAAGADIDSPTAAETKGISPELLLIYKTKVPIVFVGEIRDIFSNFEGRPPDRLPRNSDLFVSVRVLKTLKSPDGKPLSGQIYLRFGGIFQLPRSSDTTWEELTSAFAGRRFMFFGYDVTEVGTGVLVVNSGRPIRPEPAEKEEEVRRFLRLKN